MLAILTFALIAQQAKAAPYVSEYKWLGYCFRGYDYDYYNDDIVAYEEGSTATLMVQMYSDLADKAPFRVKLLMDWMSSNVTSDEVEIEGGTYHRFEITFEVPDVDEASNLYLHDYKIYYQYTVGTTVSTYKYTLPSGYYMFAVYSSDQVDMIDLKSELDTYPDLTTITTFPPIVWTAEGRELGFRAKVEENLGDRTYLQGDFASAKTHYVSALNLTKTAVSTDMEKTGGVEDSVIGILDSLKNQVAFQGYAWLLFGLGFILMSIGAIIYLVRKSGTRQAT